MFARPSLTGSQPDSWNGRLLLESLANRIDRRPVNEVSYFIHPFAHWSITDLAYGLRHVASGGSIEGLESVLSGMMGEAQVMVTNLGRTALMLGLKAIGLSSGAGVLLPAVVCPTVIRAVIDAGFCPVIVDIGDDLQITPEAISNDSLSKARALIVPHLYGLSAPITRLLQWADTNGLPVIDDAAQAFGISVDGASLGSFGKIGILSFGPYKSLACPRGGALISRDACVVARCRETLLTGEGYIDAVRRIGSGMVKSCTRRYCLRQTNSITRISATKATGTGRHSTDEPAGLNSLEAGIVSRMLARTGDILQQRRQTARKIFEIVGHFDGIEFLGPADAPYVKIPVRLSANVNIAHAVSRLRDKRIEAERIYRPLHLYPQFARYLNQPLPCAMKSWQDTLLIPNPTDSSPRALSRLSAALAEVFDAKLG